MGVPHAVLQRKLLLIEDDRDLAESMVHLLDAEGFEVTWVGDGESGQQEVARQDFSLVITDFRLPGKGGMEVLTWMRQAKPALPVVLMTAHGSAELTIRAMQLGAFDYLLKPFRFDHLLDVVKRAMRTSSLSGKRIEIGAERDRGADVIIGNSRAMQEVYKQLGRLANKAVTVLIQGETGTGKELVARALRRHSERAEGPFVAVNCSAIPEGLLESELFGHERGAYTGADRKHIGRFEQAQGGTLFLDEIGDMPLQTQVKLLRVLQERVIARVGGVEEIPIDVRIIAATNHSLEEAISQGTFREDLYFRLSSAVIWCPPLRERGDDVRLLAEYFLRQFAGAFHLERRPVVEEKAFLCLQDHAWPGNVRELENLIKRALLASQGYPITAHLIQELLNNGHAQDPGRISWNARILEVLRDADEGRLEQGFHVLVEEFERNVFAEAMRFAGSNQSQVARLLGISRVTLREKLDRYGLFPKRTGKPRRP